MLYDKYDSAEASASSFGSSALDPPTLPQGQWSLVALVFSPPLMSLYVNGALALEVGMPWSLDPAADLQLRSTYGNEGGAPRPLFTSHRPWPCLAAPPAPIAATALS